MTPDELLGVWMELIQSVVGPKGQWRREALTFDEWKEIDYRWLVIKQMGVRQAAAKELSNDRARD